MSLAVATPFTILFLVQTVISQITGTYPVLLTSTAGSPQPTGNGNDLLSYPKCAVSTLQSSPRLATSDRELSKSVGLLFCPAHVESHLLLNAIAARSIEATSQLAKP